jgi:2,3-diphosphopglycerate-independent phosphoglycerate mutase
MARPARVLLVLIDGVGDVALHGQRATPLSLAKTPVLDMVARVGANGLIDPVEPGLACGSDTAHLSLFGYDPRVVYRGRGAFESLGAGMDMKMGDIAFKSNFAVVDDRTGVVLKRRVDRSFEEAGPVLCEALDGLCLEMDGSRYRVYCRHAAEHRCGVVVREEEGQEGGRYGGLSDQIEGTDPLKDGLELRVARALAMDGVPGNETGETRGECEIRERTARVVNAVSDRMREVLRAHPLNKEREREGKAAANVVLLRGCGSLLELPSFEERHGVRACMVAPTKIIAGLGKSVGMDALDVEGATGDYRSDFRNKAVRMAQALGDVSQAPPYGFGFLHIKAVDDASHDRDVSLKVSCLEVVDAMLGQLIKALRDADAGQLVVGITGDHSTPVQYGDHSHEPVPFVMGTVNDIVRAMSDDVLDAISMDALPLPEDVQSMSSDERIDAYFPWKRKLMGLTTLQNLEPAQTDDVTRFSETDSAKGCLGRFPGLFVVPTLFRLGEATSRKENTRVIDGLMMD